MKTSGNTSNVMDCWEACSIKRSTLVVVAALFMYSGAAWTAAARNFTDGILHQQLVLEMNK